MYQQLRKSSFRDDVKRDTVETRAISGGNI